MDNAIGAIIGLAIVFFFFLLGRELICWYFKINRRVELLEQIHEELKKR
jgi:hypothetical protein